MEGRCQVCGLDAEISGSAGEQAGQCDTCRALLSTLDSEAPTSDKRLHPDPQTTEETHALFDTDPAFERPDWSEGAASPEDYPDERRYNQFEHEDWMSDLRSLAAQSMAVNTNNRSDSSPELEASKNGPLMIQASSVFPAAGPFEVPAPLLSKVAPAVAPPAPSGRRQARWPWLFAGLAALVMIAVFAIRSGMSRPALLHLQKSEMERVSRSAAEMISPGEALGEGRASRGGGELPSPRQATAVSTAGPPSAPMTPRPREKGNSAGAVTPPVKGENPPAAEAPVAPPPAPSPQTLAEAMERAAGAKPAAPAATGEPAAPPQVQPFNRGAAMSALRGIAGSLSSCNSGSQGSGKGAIRVTFAPSGHVTSAVVEGGPFTGTPTGSCVAQRFRGARIPPFSGGPVTVRQGFTVR